MPYPQIDRIALRRVTTIVVLCEFSLQPRSAFAILLTSSAGIPADDPIIDFSQFAATGRVSFNTGDPPLAVDNLANETVLVRPISGTSVVALLLGEHTPPAYPSNDYYLGPNGHWSPGRNGFLGVGGGDGTAVRARIEFSSGPVSLVGGLFNYPPTFIPIFMTALDKNLSIIEQHVISAEAPISTPGQIDAGEFRGMMRSQNEIFALDISAPFAVIDDIRFSRIIPEPSTLLMTAVTVLFAVFHSRANKRWK